MLRHSHDIGSISSLQTVALQFLWWHRSVVHSSFVWGKCVLYIVTVNWWLFSLAYYNKQYGNNKLFLDFCCCAVQEETIQFVVVISCVCLCVCVFSSTLCFVAVYNIVRFNLQHFWLVRWHFTFVRVVFFFRSCRRFVEQLSTKKMDF